MATRCRQDARPSACIVTLGCPKNEVDSASMAALLKLAGYRIVADPQRASVVVVNTCAFIEPARQESLAVLTRLAHGKRDGQCLVAAGCLAERWRGQLRAAIPGIDGLVGTRRWQDIATAVTQLRSAHTATRQWVGRAPSACTPPLPQLCRCGPTAYVKIADGCRRRCAFCAIPLIKGPAVSRPPAAIVEDVRRLSDDGVREIVLVAQETTDYGRDLGLVEGLAQLLTALTEQVPAIAWIRILYAHPASVTPRLMAVMADLPPVVPYLDLPLQHADRQVLQRMRRPADPAATLRLIDRLRRAVPGIALRSTFIVGHPGESEAAFRNLLAFVEAVRFDHVGAFCYSREPGTAAAEQDEPVAEATKAERLGELMACQQAISLAHHRALVGQTMAVLIEGRGDGVAIGRTYRDAPDIDGLTVVTNDAPVGQIVPVRLHHATAYDLFGERIATEGQPSLLQAREVS